MTARRLLTIPDAAKLTVAIALLGALLFMVWPAANAVTIDLTNAGPLALQSVVIVPMAGSRAPIGTLAPGQTATVAVHREAEGNLFIEHDTPSGRWLITVDCYIAGYSNGSMTIVVKDDAATVTQEDVH